VEATAERLIEPLVLGAAGVLGLALAAPLAVAALPVGGALWWLRTRRRAVRLGAYCACAVPALAAATVALGMLRGDALALATRYVDVQLDAGRAILTGWPAVDWRTVGPAYAGGPTP
jgi:hypothetical protein